MKYLLIACILMVTANADTIDRPNITNSLPESSANNNAKVFMASSNPSGNTKANMTNMSKADFLVWLNVPTNNVYTANGTLTGNRIIQGGNFDLEILGVGDMLISAADIFEATADRTRISGTTELSILTPAVLASTAVNGQVLTLVDAANGKVEFQNASASSPITVTDSSAIDFTLTGQDITATLVGLAGSANGTVLTSNGSGGVTWTATHAAATVADTQTVDLTIAGQNITAAIVGAGAATAGQAPVSNGSGGITWTATHAAATVTDSATIDLTLTGQNITAGILGAGAATAGQVPASDGSGGITWTTPLSSVITSGAIEGDGTTLTPIKLIDGTTAGDYLKWDGTQWATEPAFTASNIYNTDGSLTADRIITGAGFDLTTLAIDNYFISTANFYVQATNDVTLEAAQNMNIKTPAVVASTATVGQVLTLTNSLLGKVEYQSPLGSLVVAVAIPASATEVTVAIPVGKTADDLVSLTVKELGNFPEEIGTTSWRDDGAGNIIVELLGSPTTAGQFQLRARW